MLIGKGILVSVLTLLACSNCIGEPHDEVPVVALDRDFAFAYSSWQNKARISGGVAHLDADGMKPQGGAGVVENLDLSRYAESSPTLRVATGPRNSMKALRWLIRDTAGRTAEWRFELPGSSNEAVLKPVDAAPFDRGNIVSKDGPPDLAKIMQWQFIGDWSGDGPVDLKVLGIAAVPPDAAALQSRAQARDREIKAQLAAQQQRRENRTHYQAAGPQSPVVDAVYTVSPQVLAIRVREGKISPASLQHYSPQPGDERQAIDGKLMLLRNHQPVGLLIGPPGKESGLEIQEGFSGDPLLAEEADDPSNYRIQSKDDPNYATAIAPLSIARKSKPDDWQQFTQQGVVVEHTIYLNLAKPLKTTKSYSISLGHLNTDKRSIDFIDLPDRTWSEAIHVSQIGFRPDDPVKRAYLSLWAGSAGGIDWPDELKFKIVDDATGTAVFNSVVGAAWPADRAEVMQTTRNFNGTSVRPIDFSSLNAPGRYRVVVDGVGCSYPFSIDNDRWKNAFAVQMKGFYNQRSGIDAGPPFSPFRRPADFKTGVNDAMPITQSTFSNLDQNGTLAGGDTGKPVPEAWGGYHDAGDWNPRRVTHMTTTTFWQLELLQLFPDYFRTLTLNIPNDAPGPDLLKESLFELDLFHRLQLPDGGVRFGIETDGDPYGGEVSWKQNMPAYVYAADAEASYIYAAVAARAAEVLATIDPRLSETYRTSALSAMRWAEADRDRRIAAGTWNAVKDRVSGRRNLAAACLLSLTKDSAWDGIFKQDTALAQVAPPAFRGDDAGRDAAFSYARLPQGVGDKQLKDAARRAVLADADGSLDYQQHNAFGIASSDPGKPQFLGFYSNPHGAVSLVRAHYLTQDKKYLAGAVAACLFPAGANPSNIIYTSGLGSNAVKALNLDALATGQPPPVGLTPYGNIDLQRWATNKEGAWIVWPINFFLGKHAEPGIFDWPTTEAYFDVRFWPALTEFCVDQTMGPNAYVWGYLAARP